MQAVPEVVHLKNDPIPSRVVACHFHDDGPSARVGEEREAAARRVAVPMVKVKEELVWVGLSNLVQVAQYVLFGEPYRLLGSHGSGSVHRTAGSWVTA